MIRNIKIEGLLLYFPVERIDKILKLVFSRGTQRIEENEKKLVKEIFDDYKFEMTKFQINFQRMNLDIMKFIEILHKNQEIITLRQARLR